jgi:hypothetical protein
VGKLDQCIWLVYSFNSNQVFVDDNNTQQCQGIIIICSPATASIRWVARELTPRDNSQSLQTHHNARVCWQIIRMIFVRCNYNGCCHLSKSWNETARSKLLARSESTKDWITVNTSDC